ncbi:MAG: ribosomal-processing cysteine protease Prp [Bacilli bacterium]|nr:ribosomal-processing cysteine protease Prp [Bacilli bacterium]
MIRIEIKKTNDKYTEIIFKGHANYDVYGKDIVCAAVSSTMLCTVNAIYLINADSIKTIEENNKFTIEVIKDDNIINKLLENMIHCLESLEEQYPKSIKIK